MSQEIYPGSPSYYVLKEDFEPVEESLYSLSSSTVTIKTNLENLSGSTVSLSSSTVTIEGNLSDLSDSVDNLSGATVNLSAGTVTIESDLNTLSGSTVSLSSSTVSIETNVTNLSAGTINDITTLSGNTTHGLDLLKTDIDNVSASTVALSSSTVTIETNLNTLSSSTISLSASTVNIEDSKNDLIYNEIPFTFVGNCTVDSDGLMIKKELSSGYNNLLALTLTSNKIVINERVKMVTTQSQEFLNECIITSATTSDGFLRITKYGSSQEFQVIIQPTDGGTRLFIPTTGLTTTINDTIDIEIVFEKPNITVTFKNITKGTSCTITDTASLGTGTVLKNISSYINGVGNYGMVSFDLKHFSVTSNGTDIITGYLKNTRELNGKVVDLTPTTANTIYPNVYYNFGTLSTGITELSVTLSNGQYTASDDYKQWMFGFNSGPGSATIAFPMKMPDGTSIEWQNIPASVTANKKIQVLIFDGCGIISEFNGTV